MLIIEKRSVLYWFKKYLPISYPLIYFASIMTLQEFIQLNEVEQEEVVWDNGSFITTEDKDHLIYDLYKIDSFYVRFSYLLDKPETITITASANLAQLNSLGSINAAWGKALGNTSGNLTRFLLRVGISRMGNDPAMLHFP